MKIITLMEDTLGKTEAKAEHGLSFYIETNRHKILADTGASDLTWENARLLGVDVSNVDTVFISHGHYDHTGGLLDFGRKYPDAVIYMQKSALGAYYHGERYIGVDRQILELPQLCLIEGNCVIDQELELFSGITGRKYWPESNRELTEKAGEGKIQDQFLHEQCLVIRQEDGMVLISGCAHNGILNILDTFEQLYHTYPKRVISGFHMSKKTAYTEQDKKMIEDTAKQLYQYPTVFYTGHCTGQFAFDLMKEIMGNRLIQLHTGEEIV